MGNKLRAMGLAVLMVGLMALPAFAGVATVGGVTPSVAYEAMGIARNILDLGPVTYQSTQDIQQANVIRVNLVNANLISGVPYYLCDAGGVQVGVNLSPPSLTQVDFQIVTLGAPVAQPVTLTNDPCGGANLFDFTLLTGVSNATIQFTQFCITGACDTSNAALLVTVAPEYAVGVISSTHYIDVIAGTGSTFTPQTGTSPTGVLGAAPVIQTDSRQGTNLASPYSIRIAVATLTNPVASFGLNAYAQITFTDTNGFQGVSKIFIAAGGTACDSTATAPAPGNLVQASSPAPTGVTVTLPSEANGGFDQTTLSGVGGTRDFRVCVLTDGTSFIEPRTISANVDIQVPNGGINPFPCCNDPAPTGALAAQNWLLTGGDIRATGVKGAPAGNETNISLNNLGPTNATVTRMDVYQIDSTGLAAAPACTLTAEPTVNKAIHANGGTTIKGSEIVAACSAAAPFVLTEAFGVRILTTVAPGNLSGQATRIFPSGEVMSVPILKLGNAFANE